jgi:hypothetical protein
LQKANGPESLGAVARSLSSFLAGLEVELQANLHDTRIADCANLIEARGREVRRSAADGVRAVECVNEDLGFLSRYPPKAALRLENKKGRA